MRFDTAARCHQVGARPVDLDRDDSVDGLDDDRAGRYVVEIVSEDADNHAAQLGVGQSTHLRVDGARGGRVGL